jgi:hypothetical protein
VHDGTQPGAGHDSAVAAEYTQGGAGAEAAECSGIVVQVGFEAGHAVQWEWSEDGAGAGYDSAVTVEYAQGGAGADATEYSGIAVQVGFEAGHGSAVGVECKTALVQGTTVQWQSTLRPVLVQRQRSEVGGASAEGSGSGVRSEVRPRRVVAAE